MVRSTIVQLGFVVSDLQPAAMEWTRRFGIGPWFYWDHLTGREYLHRGRPSHPDVSTAMADWNGIQIQLVQQHDESSSPHADFLAAHGHVPGLNQLAVAVPDFAAELRRRTARGETPIVEAGFPVNNVFYHWDDWNLPALELSERRPPSTVRRLYEVVSAAARDWDGGDPWRPVPDLTDDHSDGS